MYTNGFNEPLFVPDAPESVEHLRQGCNKSVTAGSLRRAPG